MTTMTTTQKKHTHIANGDPGSGNKAHKRGGPKTTATISARHDNQTGQHNRLISDLNIDIVELPPELAELPPKHLCLCILRNVGYSLTECCEAMNLSNSQICRILNARGWTVEAASKGGMGLPRLPPDIVRAYRISKYQRLETLAVDQAIAQLPEASARDASQIAERASNQLHLHKVESEIDTPSLHDIRAKLKGAVKAKTLGPIINV